MIDPAVESTRLREAAQACTRARRLRDTSFASLAMAAVLMGLGVVHDCTGGPTFNPLAVTGLAFAAAHIPLHVCANLSAARCRERAAELGIR